MELINFLIGITDEKVYSRGVNLYNDEKVHDLFESSSINLDEELIIKIASNVEASDSMTEYDTHISFTQFKLLDYSCECVYFLTNSYKKICKHLIAAFLTYTGDKTKNISFKKPDKSDLDEQFFLSNSLLAEYKEKSNLSSIKDKYILKFSIVILYNRINSIELEVYNHNNDRTYKVRNIGDFLKTYINKKIHKFTDKFSIDFKHSNFVIDNKIKAVWKVLFHNYELADSPSYYEDNLFNGPYGIISVSQLVEILESLKGQNVNIKNKTHYSFSDNSMFYRVSKEAYNFNFIHDEKKLTLQINSHPKFNWGNKLFGWW